MEPELALEIIQFHHNTKESAWTRQWNNPGMFFHKISKISLRVKKSDKEMPILCHREKAFLYPIFPLLG